jgi:MFS superfamily sulfate permease-like transporter
MLNLGELIRFVSYPVMVGFTTAAAMVIGLSQLKNVFGFGKEVPNVGADNGVDYNWQQMKWYSENWNQYVNPQAAAIGFGVYIPLLIIYILRKVFRATPERKKNIIFRVWDFFSVCSTMLAIIFGDCLFSKVASSVNPGAARGECDEKIENPDNAA